MFYRHLFFCIKEIKLRWFCFLSVRFIISQKLSKVVFCNLFCDSSFFTHATHFYAFHAFPRVFHAHLCVPRFFTGFPRSFVRSTLFHGFPRLFLIFCKTWKQVVYTCEINDLEPWSCLHTLFSDSRRMFKICLQGMEKK